MRILFLFFSLSIIVSCKKKEDCPAPKAGQTIVNDIPGTYSGYFTTTINYNHGLNYKDTTVESLLYFHDTPTNNYENTTSTVTSVDIDGQSVSNFSYYYYFSAYYDSINPISLRGLFNNINYNFNSSSFGTININDVRIGGNFSNNMSLPLNFSNSTPYVISLNNITNTTKIKIDIYNAGGGIVERIVLPTNPTAKFYASEFNNTSVGSSTGMDVSLINMKDTIINGFKFKLEKIVRHRYTLTYTN